MRILHSTVTALVVTGALVAHPALAQSGAGVEEVVVVEAPIVRQPTGPAAQPGMQTEVIELHRQVGFADLDLSRHADVVELERRIETTAQNACAQLDELFPLERSNTAERNRCVRKAIESAQQDMEAAIAAAG